MRTKRLFGFQHAQTASTPAPVQVPVSAKYEGSGPQLNQLHIKLMIAAPRGFCVIIARYHSRFSGRCKHDHGFGR